MAAGILTSSSPGQQWAVAGLRAGTQAAAVRPSLVQGLPLPSWELGRVLGSLVIPI